MSNEGTRMLSVSTSHISRKTADWLNEQGEINATSHETGKMAVLHIGAHGYGWFIYCHDDGTEDYPADLVRVMDYARKNHKCEYVNLDADGYEWSDLEEYEW